MRKTLKKDKCIILNVTIPSKKNKHKNRGLLRHSFVWEIIDIPRIGKHKDQINDERKKSLNAQWAVYLFLFKMYWKLQTQIDDLLRVMSIQHVMFTISATNTYIHVVRFMHLKNSIPLIAFPISPVIKLRWFSWFFVHRGETD